MLSRITVDELQRKEVHAYAPTQGAPASPLTRTPRASRILDAQPIAGVLTQHMEGASFLWGVRDLACNWPHYTVRDLARLDGRVEAHLDGLRIAGDHGLQHCLAELGWQQPGEIFAASVLALAARDENALAQVSAAIAKRPALARGLVSAIGWSSFSEVEARITRLAGSSTPWKQRAGIAGFAVHRRDPGELLNAALQAESPWVRARALRAAGELGRTDVVPLLAESLWSRDAECAFWAAWATALLAGYTRSLERLQEIAEQAGPFQERAFSLALRCLPRNQALAWLKRVAAQSPRLGVIGAGVLGDPVLIPDLVEQMGTPALARVAGEAFTMITGADLVREQLEGAQPEGFVVGPTDDPKDEDVSLDPDERLPWPNPSLVTAWFRRCGNDLPPGTRLLLGRPLHPKSLQTVLREGRQRQRAAAALELVLLQRGTPLPELRAPGFEQERGVR